MLDGQEISCGSMVDTSNGLIFHDFVSFNLYEVGARSYKYTGRSNAAWIRVKKWFACCGRVWKIPPPSGMTFPGHRTLRFLIFKFPVTKGNNSAKTVSYGCRRLKKRNICCVDGGNDCMLNLKLTLSIGETLGNCFRRIAPPWSPET